MRKMTRGGWLALVALFVLAARPSVAPAANWSRTFDLDDKDDRAVAVTTDADGNIYVLATCGKDTQGDCSDVVVLRYGPDGGTLEVWVYNSGSYDTAIAFVVDDHDPNAAAIYVAAYAGGNFHTVKLDGESAGEELWHVVMGYAADDRPSDIALQYQDGVWGVVVTGSSQVENRGYDYSTVSYRPDGAQYWARVYPGSYGSLPVMDDYATAVACDDQGRVYVTGRINRSNPEDYEFCTVRYDVDGGVNPCVAVEDEADSELAEGATDIAVDFEAPYNVYVTGAFEREHTGRQATYYHLDAVTFRYNYLLERLDRKKFGDEFHDEEPVELVARM
ncbi:MAG: hypothetical protein ABIK86_07705 [candidate division WOR-3 bacterium]